jgi:GT2 family glycosyltransferase
MTGTADAGTTLSDVRARPDADLRPSVVICAFTDARWTQLVRAVASVHAQTSQVHELIVVIDHNEQLYQRAKEHLRARVLRNTSTQGLSGARNTGLATATGNVVVFLDDDAYAESDWLANLLEPYQDPTVVAVGGHVVPAFDAGRPPFLPSEFDWVVGCSYRGLPTVPADVRNVIGANMSFRRSVFDDVGGFAVSLGRIGSRPLGCEETELCIRATAGSGGRVVLQPSARVHHQVPAARTTWAYFRSRCFAEGLSKAAVARLAGPRRGLASERSYVSRTLPSGVALSLLDAVRTRRASGVTRAAAIVSGLGITTAGYVLGSLRSRRAESSGVRSPAGAAPSPAASASTATA